MSELKYLYMTIKFTSGARFPPSTLFGPFNFEVTAIHFIFLKMLNYFFGQTFKTVDRLKYYFQQNGAPAHNSKYSFDFFLAFQQYVCRWRV